MRFRNTKFRSSPVVELEVYRLSLVAWDVPTFCARFPVPSGVRP